MPGGEGRLVRFIGLTLSCRIDFVMPLQNPFYHDLSILFFHSTLPPELAHNLTSLSAMLERTVSAAGLSTRLECAQI